MDRALHPAYEQLLARSGIAPNPATSRGYQPLAAKAEAEGLAFTDSRAQVPALLCDLHDARGVLIEYDDRPGRAHVDQEGTPIQYEIAGAGRTTLDVPLAMRKQVNDRQVPLWITPKQEEN
jgi:hypothetical protein